MQLQFTNKSNDTYLIHDKNGNALNVGDKVKVVQTSYGCYNGIAIISGMIYTNQISLENIFGESVGTFIGDYASDGNGNLKAYSRNDWSEVEYSLDKI
jgi:hypothetical protein